MTLSFGHHSEHDDYFYIWLEKTDQSSFSCPHSVSPRDKKRYLKQARRKEAVGGSGMQSNMNPVGKEAECIV